MPATTSDIIAASRDVAVASWSSPTIAGRYPSARDGSTGAAEGFFDAMADAQAVADARGALLGAERRRFVAVTHDLVWSGVTTGLPQVQLIDAEQNVNATFLSARIEVDLEAGTTSFELFG